MKNRKNSFMKSLPTFDVKFFRRRYAAAVAAQNNISNRTKTEIKFEDERIATKSRSIETL